MVFIHIKGNIQVFKNLLTACAVGFEGMGEMHRY